MTLLVVIAVWAAVAAAARRRAMRADRTAVMQRWLHAAPADREAVLNDCIGTGRPNPGAWYLLGFDRLRRGAVRDAARAFGMAYHQDAELESAALLTFACLKAKTDVAFDVLDQIAITWHEMRRPALADRPTDFELIEMLMAREHDIPPHLTGLGRIAWLAAGPQGRQRLRERTPPSEGAWQDFFDARTA